MEHQMSADILYRKYDLLESVSFVLESIPKTSQNIFMFLATAV